MADLSEQDIKKITEEVVRQLGDAASSDSVEKVLRDTVARVEEKQPAAAAPPAPTMPSVRQNRIIVTAFGKNRSGILAGLTGILAEHRCDILDLSQKILQDFFTVMLLVDISDCDLGFDTVKQTIVHQGEALDLKVIVQHEDIFNAMHRI